MTAQNQEPDGWTGNAEADAALVMLDRLDSTSEEDDSRIDAIAKTIRRLTASPQSTAELEAKIAEQRSCFVSIVEMAAGFDEHGATGPKPPLSWESVARLSIDLARAQLKKATA